MGIRGLLRTMLYRRGNITGSLVAQTLAVAVMFATLLLGYSSGQGPGVTYRYANADAVVRVNPTTLLNVDDDMVPEAFGFRMPEAALDDLRTIEGVDDVLPDRTFGAVALDGDGAPLDVEREDSRGVAWSVAALTPFALVEGEAPAGNDEIVIDRVLARAGGYGVGDPVDIVTRESTSTFTVAGIAAPPDGDTLPRQASLFFTQETADRLAPPSQGTLVAGLIYSDDADMAAVAGAIREVSNTHSLDVLTGPDRGRADLTAGQAGLDDLGFLFLMLGGIVGFVSIFVIASTFGFAIQQRTHEIAIQRAIGYTPRQVRRGIALEAAIIGVAGAGLGVGLGTAGAWLFIAIMKVIDRAPREISLHFWDAGIWWILAISLCISQVAVFIAGHRAASIRPAVALRESAARQRWFSPVRTLAGAGLVACAIACFAIAPSAGADGAIGLSFMVTMCATIGIACLAPVLVYMVSSVSHFVLGRCVGVTTRVAIRNSRARSARVGSAVGVIVLSLGFATLIACFNATLETGVTENLDRSLEADVFVVPGTHVMPHGAGDAMRGIDGVNAVSGAYDFEGVQIEHDAEGEIEIEEVSGRAVDPRAMGEMVDVSFAEGNWDGLVPGTVFVTAETASWYGLGIGSSWTMTMPDMREIELQISGVIEQPLGNAEVIISQQDAMPYLIDPSMTEMMVTVEAGVAVDDIIPKIEHTGVAGAPLVVVDKADYISAQNAGLRENAWAGNMVIGGAAAFGAIAAINTIVMSTYERGREFSLMRLIGSLERQVLQMVNAESLMLALLASVLGIGIGVLSASAVSFGLVGDASALTVPVTQVGFYGVIALVVVCLSAHVPARSRLRDANASRSVG